MATRVALGEGEKKAQDLSRQNARPGGLSADAEASDTGRAAHGPFVDEGQTTQQTTPPSTSRDPRRVPPPAQGPARDVAPTAPATGTAVVSGRVTLEDGQAVRRARVTLRNAETRLERAAATDENGRFLLSGLPGGRYSLLANKAAYLTTY